MKNKKLTVSTIALVALLSAAPAQAWDWFSSWFGTGAVINDIDAPTKTVLGPGGGGGDPGIDPN